MDNIDLISIIIPVYNVEKYLKTCVDSVINQTYTNLEIYLVDDGSTDGCPQICDEYSKLDSRVRVIHKENGGLSDARNAALDKISGKYLMYVDSDDFIRTEMVEILYDLIRTHDADIAIGKLESGSKDSFSEPLKCKEESEQISEKILNLIFDDKYRTFVIPSCGKLYKSELFSEIRFPKGKIHEDEYVIHRVLDICEKVIVVNENLYYHYVREDSITRSNYSLKSLEAINAIEDRIRFCENKKDDELLFLCYRDYLRRVQFHYYSLKKYFPAEKEIILNIRNKYKEYYKAISDKAGMKDKLRYGLFLWLPGVNAFIKKCAGARRV